MKMENFIISSIPIEVSEFPNHKEATFLISVLDEYNSNKVLIEKEDGEKYHNSIIGYPILAYLKYDKDGKPNDFGGHELRAKYNSETKEIDYYFATHPIGSVIESWIEQREVEGYVGEKSVILIKTKLWKSRFPEYFKVFDKLWEDGNLSSSWEISASKSEKTTQGKVLKAFEFIGNTILGSSVVGAVRSAGVLEVASNDEINFDLSSAFLEDIQKTTSIDSSLSEEDVSNTDISEDKDNINLNKEGGNDSMNKENKTEVSGITDNDLYSKVRKAINSTSEDKYFYVAMLYPYEFKAIANTWDRASDEDFVQFSYSVNSDETISIVSQEDVKMKFIPKTELETQLSELEEKVTSAEKEIAEAGKSITELSKEKEGLETQISELTVYKDKVVEMEQAEAERELSEKKEQLKAFALEDDLIEVSELEVDEKLVQLFAELTLENYETSQEKIETIKGRKAIQKFKETKLASKQAELEVSEIEEVEVKAKTNLDEDAGVLSPMEIVKAMLKK